MPESHHFCSHTIHIDITTPTMDDNNSDMPGLQAPDFQDGEDDDDNDIQAARVLHGLRATDDAAGALASPAAAAAPPGDCDLPFFLNFARDRSPRLFPYHS